MELNITPHRTQQHRQNNQSFTGFGTATASLLRFLDTNQAVGANCVDLCSMVIPRTTVDFINRGPAAGAETGRREATGTANHSSVGLYGTLAGFAVAAGFNKKYGISAHKIFADNKTIDAIAESWHSAVKSNSSDPLRQHVNTFIDNIKVQNSNGFEYIPAQDKQKIVDALYNGLKNSNDRTINKDLRESLQAMITAATGGEKNVVLVGKDGKEAANTLKTLISNFYNSTKAFSTEKAIETFKNSADISSNELVNSLKNMNLKRSIGGLGIATAIGMSTQPINMYLTKKKTGSDGFVGVEGREKDKSAGFKIMKTLAATAFAIGALATITTNPKKFLSKIQFQGMLPTIDQLKLVYGLTISSRLLSARDKDELRESTVKDTLGFLNLLILGTTVTKYTAKAFDKSLINQLETQGKGWLSKLTNSTLKTRDEVLLPVLKKHGFDVVKDGKAIPYKELLSKIPSLPKAEQDALNKKLRALNISQIVGYLYSGLVLGIGIPKLNIYMTNKSEAKRKAKLAAAGNDNAPKFNGEQNLMFSASNIEFLKTKSSNHDNILS